MSISTTQTAAIKAGLRTAEQALTMGLGVLTGGGAFAGATNWFSIDWKELGGALAFVLLTAFFAGLKAYLSFLTNGVPAAYKAAQSADGSYNVTSLPAPPPAVAAPASAPLTYKPTTPPTVTINAPAQPNADDVIASAVPASPAS